MQPERWKVGMAYCGNDIIRATGNVDIHLQERLVKHAAKICHRHTQADYCDACIFACTLISKDLVQ